jgi:hypothetical protein
MIEIVDTYLKLARPDFEVGASTIEGAKLDSIDRERYVEITIEYKCQR